MFIRIAQSIASLSKSSLSASSSATVQCDNDFLLVCHVDILAPHRVLKNIRVLLEAKEESVKTGKELTAVKAKLEDKLGALEKVRKNSTKIKI